MNRRSSAPVGSAGPALVFAMVLGALSADRLPAQAHGIFEKADAASAGVAEAADADQVDRRVYTELLELAHERYATEVGYEDLGDAALAGMIRTLDPHSSYHSPAKYAAIKQRNSGRYAGVGLLVAMRDGNVTVTAPVDGGPAARLGIQAGDVIGAIDGEATRAMSIEQAISRIKGPPGTEVHLVVERRGLAAPLALTLTRVELSQATVTQAYMLTPDIGYIKLRAFARPSGGEVADAIARLQGAGMQRLLLDLRDNGGGDLSAGADIAGQLFPEGSALFDTRGRVAGSSESFRASGERPVFGGPLVVLVNKGSASASELVAGAVQDHDRGLVVGESTWGKGVVQTVFNLAFGAGLSLTTHRLHLPSGRTIQRDYSSYFDYHARADVGTAEVTGKPVDASRVFTTALGRTVHGGAAITPDVVVEPADAPPLASLLMARNVFVKFAVDFTRVHREQIVAADWLPGPELEQELGAWVIAEGIATPEEVANMDAALREVALRHARAEILGLVFDQETRHRAFAEGDEPLRVAVTLFDRAAALLAQRQALDAR